MSESPKTQTVVHCACGRVAFEATGTPIACVACHCKDCRDAARQIEALPEALPVLDTAGGVDYVLYRKNRLICTQGAQLLQSRKLQKNSATSRTVATCCNTAMSMTFDDARHWASLYRNRFQENAPPLQMRICRKPTSDKADVHDGVPSYTGFPLRFIVKLVAAMLRR